MKKYLWLSVATIFLIGCSTKEPDLSSVKQVDIQKYLGTWYEIARYDHRFEKGCKNVTATYSLKKNNDIKVVNKCTNITTNKTKEAVGSAYSTNKSNSKLKVSFFWPFYGNYWILDLDEEYKYAVIGEPSRKYLWILSREKKISQKVKKEILNKFPLYKYEVKPLIWTIQE